jgi:hypothetical protein
MAGNTYYILWNSSGIAVFSTFFSKFKKAVDKAGSRWYYSKALRLIGELRRAECEPRKSGTERLILARWSSIVSCKKMAEIDLGKGLTGRREDGKITICRLWLADRVKKQAVGE